MSRSLVYWAVAALTWAAPVAASAQGWELFRSENDNVAEGNERMAAGDPAGALEAYDAAARELPSEPGVHLSRGLALLATGESGRAREAFELAADPPAPREMRADAHYDTGVAFFGEAEAAAEGGDHDSAQRLFRDAADEFRASLRLVPGNRDAGWNLELALRRINEEEEASRAEDEERENEERENSEENSDEESSDSESCDNPTEGDGDSEGSSGDEGEESDSESGDEGEDEGSPGEDESEPSSEGEDGEESPESGDDGEANEDAEEGADGSHDTETDDERGDPRHSAGEDGTGTEGSADGEGSDLEAGGTTDRSLPSDMARVLDALEDGEENLSAARARARADRERRRVEHDW